LENQNKNINPHFAKAEKKKWDSIELVQAIQQGNKSALSHALSLAESTLEEDQLQVGQILRKHEPHFQSKRIAITGSPGAGKSSFIDSYGAYISGLDHKIAILAIDPSSPESGGSILGDKTRMDQLVHLENVYIRPSASGKSQGGVANATMHSILLCELAGYEYILIETVGVGQSEVAVKDMVDMYVLIIQPGAGDELQGIKRGIMELADLYIINKCDGDKEALAKQSAKSINNAKSLLHPKDHGHKPATILYSSVTKLNQDRIYDEMGAFFEHISANSYLDENRARQNETWLDKEINNAIICSVEELAEIEKIKTSLRDKVRSKEVLPVEAGVIIKDAIKKLFG